MSHQTMPNVRESTHAVVAVFYILLMVIQFAIYAMLLAILIGAGLGSSVAWAEPPETAHATAPVPASLDKLYPPKADAPRFQLEMLQLDSLFSGIVVDLEEGDAKGALDSLIAFKAQYQKVAAMVPEWLSYYPQGPVDELESAMRTADRGGIMAAYGKVGGLCHACHTSTMVPVQQKYHWGDFRSVAASDPLLKDQSDYAGFKRRLSANLSGIGHNLRQGQIDNARKQLEQFTARAQVLKATCLQCHTAAPRNFVDPALQERIDALRAALAGESVQAAVVDQLIQGIGKETCSKCHLVHVPAAVAAEMR